MAHERILIVEDDGIIVARLEDILTGFGYTVPAIAPSGKEAIQQAERVRPDLVLMDVKLKGGMSGIEAASQIRDQFDIPVVYLTAFVDDALLEQAKSTAPYGYLVKPVQDRELRATIEMALYKHHLDRRIHDLALLTQMGRDLTAMLEVGEVTDRLLPAAAEITHAEGASLWLWDPAQAGWLVCRAVYHQGLGKPLVNLRLPPGQGLAGWVAQTGDPALVNSASEDARFSPAIDTQTGFQTRSLLAVPLRVRSRVTGTLELVNKRTGAFDRDDLALVEALANPAAIAIENAYLVEALRQSNLALLARNAELDSFAQVVAHDLKSPLMSLIGLAEVLSLDHSILAPEQLSYYLQMITRSGRKAADIVEALLLLARVRQEEVELLPVPMTPILVEVQQRLAALIEEHQAEIKLPPPSTWPVALGYIPWVEQVWLNYISNAIKYGGRPPRLELGAALVEPENGGSGRRQVRFWVRDNGPGLAPEAQARLFTEFTRLEPTRAEGHGLGLAIVRRIVEKLGGHVGVESSPGRGSVFSFTLPAA